MITYNHSISLKSLLKPHLAMWLGIGPFLNSQSAGEVVLRPPAGVVGPAAPLPRNEAEKKVPSQIVMVLEGWCPSGDCVFSRVLDDVVDTFPDPGKLKYKRLFFIPKSELTKHVYPSDRGMDSDGNPVAPDSLLAEKSVATFLFSTKGGTRIVVNSGLVIGGSNYLQPLNVYEGLVGFEMDWNGGWKVPPAPNPPPRNPVRIESFPDDGVNVQFEVKESKDTLNWTITGATHGISVLESLDGGKTWQSVFDPSTHSLEQVGTSDHNSSRDYRWKVAADHEKRLVSQDAGKTWAPLKLSRRKISTDGGQTWHLPIETLEACPSKEHAIDISDFKASSKPLPRFLFQGARGLRVFWRLYEVGKGWL